MKPGLEAVGRYDERRVRNRFLDTFMPADTWKIVLNHILVGFFAYRDNHDHLYLDHLYIHPDFQNQKIGRAVIAHLSRAAAEKMIPLRLGALRNSPANHFYLSNGFKKIGEGEFDIFYELIV